MENLELRMAVAEANGWTTGTNKGGEFAMWPPGSDKKKWPYGISCPHYELDDHHALDALKEFCEKGDGDRKYLFEILQTQNGRYRVIIFYRSTLECIAEKVDKSLAKAASLVIREAAKGKK